MTQQEFDKQMSNLNHEQEIVRAPYAKRIEELNKQMRDAKLRLQAIKLEMITIGGQISDVQLELKTVNRYYHNLKHELIVANPKSETMKESAELGNEGCVQHFDND